MPRSVSLQRLLYQGRKGHPLDRINALEQDAEINGVSDVNVNELSEITNNLGHVTAGEFIAPAADATSGDPTDSGFTGAAMGGNGWTFNGVVYQFVAVENGVLQAGFNSAGKLLAGTGSVTLDSDGISIVASDAPNTWNKISFTGQSVSPATIHSTLTQGHIILTPGAGSSAGQIYALGTLRAQGNFTLIGSDDGATTLTDNTDKYARLGLPHYDSDEEAVSLIFGQSISGNNYLNIGGGTSFHNAVTQIRLLTAPTTTTTTGTERLKIDSSGNLTINDPGENADTRIEGDTDQNLVFVDASANAVGIGTNAPVELLDVDGTLGSGVHYLDEGSAPSTPASGKAAIYASTGSRVRVINDAGTDINLFAIPETAMVFAQQFIYSATTGTSQDLSQRFAFYRGPTAGNAANGDTIDISFVVAAGTYTLTIFGVKDSDCGITDGTIDGAAAFTGDDWYNALGLSRNQSFSHSVTIATGGRHVLRLTVNGKNVGSSDYAVRLTDIYLAPSAYTAEA